MDFSLLLADLKLPGIGSYTENPASPDGTACNLRIPKQHHVLISSPLR